MDRATAHARLRDKGLRSTSPRVTVLRGLAKSPHPVSYSELVRQLGRGRVDPATVYRTLIRLTEVGLARVASRGKGSTRYELLDPSPAVQHQQPRFTCRGCDAVTHLDAAVMTKTDDIGWRTALSSADLQFEGLCPNCID